MHWPTELHYISISFTRDLDVWRVGPMQFMSTWLSTSKTINIYIHFQCLFAETGYGAKIGGQNDSKRETYFLFRIVSSIQESWKLVTCGSNDKQSCSVI